MTQMIIAAVRCVEWSCSMGVTYLGIKVSGPCSRTLTGHANSPSGSQVTLSDFSGHRMELCKM